MLVAGSMIGSGIFIVSADIARQVGSAGWLLAVWGLTGGAYAGSRTELRRAGRDDAAGRRPVCVSAEAYGPLWGFLYG